MKSKLLFLLFLMPLITTNAFAQSNAGSQAETKKDEASDQTSRFGFVSKVFDIKYRNPESLTNVVQVFVSGNGRITFNREMKTIMVRDRAENVAAIEDALKRFDVPEQSPISLEFHLHLIAASMGQQEKSPELDKLSPVLVQLRSALKFTNYRYINSAINRVSNGGRVESSGITGSMFPSSQAYSPDRPSFYQYSLGNVKLAMDASGKESIQIDQFKFGVGVPVKLEGGSIQYRDIGIVTPLSLREGEMAVVGTANVSGSDEAVVVVVSVKKLK